MKYKAALFAFIFLPSIVIADVIVNEINYDPIDMDEEGGSLREYIELHNPGPNAVDVSGYAFTSGFSYTFPANTIMNADSYLVLARVPTHTSWRRASYPVVGPYERKLSNGGERITLVRPDGSIVERFEYNDDFPWVRGADGYGPSLERIGWNEPAEDFRSWRASFNEGGTPGRVNSVNGTVVFSDNFDRETPVGDWAIY